MKLVSTCAVTGLAFVLSVGMTVRAQEKPAETKPATKEAEAKPAAKKEGATEGEGKPNKKGEGKPRVQVPPNFAKLDLTTAQREKLHAIDAEYDAKLEELKDQIKALSAKRDSDSEAVLTPEQKERLALVRAESKKKSAEAMEAKKKKAAEAKGDGAKPEGAKPEAPKDGETKKPAAEGTAKPEKKE